MISRHEKDQEPQASERMSNVRRALVATLVCLTVALVPSAAWQGTDALAQEAPPAAPERPNMILVLTDDLDAELVKRLPRLKSLMADRGTTFSNAFVTYSLCCPSRSSILRGQYPHNHQIVENAPPLGGWQKLRDMGHESSTVATWLQSGGYRTAYIGKYLNGYDATYIPPGWNEWYGWMGYYNPSLNASPYYRINANGEVVNHDPAQVNETDVLSNIAVDYLQRNANDERPFFMVVAPNAPHDPATPAARHRGAFAGARAPRPPSFNEKDVSDKPKWVRGKLALNSKQIAFIDDLYRKRLESMLAVEDMLGRLIGELEASGELDNTYIVFTSDNGYHMGQHRLTPQKQTAYEEDIRVPMVVRGPGVAPGRVEPRMALNNDLAPTFADLAGVPAPSFVDGRSLAPLLGGSPPPAWRTAFTTEAYGNAITPPFHHLRTNSFSYVRYGNGERELYDLRKDPYELSSRYTTASASLRKHLDSRLSALRTCAGASCRAAEGGGP